MATTVDMGRNEGELLCFFRGEMGLCLIQCGLAEDYFRTKWSLHPSSHLATIDMGQKLGGGECPHRTQRRLGRGLPPYQVVS